MSSSNLLDLQSVDPNRQLPKPPIRWWSRVLIPAIIVLGVILLLLAATWRNFLPVQSVRVEAAIAKQVGERAPASSLVQAAGWLEAFPYQTHVTALADGVAKEILVLEGDRVAAGQVVARLDAAEADLALRKAEAQLAARNAEHKKALATLDAARERWEHPVSLEQLAASASARVREQQSTLAEIKAKITEQTAVVNQARRNAERAVGLVADNVVSVQAGEQTEAVLAAEAAALGALEHSLLAATEKLQRVTVEEASAGKNLELRIEDRQRLATAKAGLGEATAAIAVAEAEVADAKLRLSRMTIASPVDGVVVTRFKAPGDKVMLHMDHPRSASIVSLYDPTQLQARVDVPLADAAQITIGQDCEITTDVMPNTRFAGKVVRLLHEADIQKNTLQAKVAIIDPTPELRPEMLCRVRFLAQATPEEATAQTSTRTFVPANALVDGQVWLAQMIDDNFATLRPHKATGDLELDGWRALDGIQTGALVVVDPPPGLEPGQRVRVMGGQQ